ncbi:MAG: hypothetical protein IJY23_06250 [Clostridia bacterium]|nr:hypothetical protein [Clostridia bacterium]
MAIQKKHTHIAYRCPECGTVIYGLVGEFALDASMMRLNCTCGKSSLDITPTNDKKIKLSVPCVLCKENHNFIVSPTLFFDREIFLGGCPYANIDILFIGGKDKVDSAVEENEKALKKLIGDMGVEALEDLQPIDMDEDEILPDAAVYDLIRFVVKDLEAEGRVDCPCHSGRYDLRYAPGGIQVFCEDCGATYFFSCASAAAAEDYLDINEISLK